MGLGLLWAKIQDTQGKGFIVSNDNKVYCIFRENNGTVVITSKEGRFNVPSIKHALNMIYSNGSNKIVFRLSSEGELKLNPLTGAGDNSLPVICSFRYDIKSYYWGTSPDGDCCIISADLTKFEVSAEFITKTEALENRRNKYLNIVGIDGEIAPKLKQLRGNPSFDAYLNTSDVIGRMPIIGIKVDTPINIKPLEVIEPYDSNFIHRYYSKDDTSEWGNADEAATRRGMLLHYGQFGRYKSAVSMMDTLLSPLAGEKTIKYGNTLGIMSSLTRVGDIAKHKLEHCNVEPFLWALRRCNFPAVLDNYLKASDKRYCVANLMQDIYKMLPKYNAYIPDTYVAQFYKGLYGYDFKHSFKMIKNTFALESTEAFVNMKSLFEESGVSVNRHLRMVAKTLTAIGKCNCSKAVTNFLTQWGNLNVNEKICAVFKLYLGRSEFSDLCRDSAFAEIYSKGKYGVNTVDDNILNILQCMFNACSFDTMVTSYKDGFTEITYNLKNTVRRAYCNIRQSYSIKENDGVMDYLKIINENPYYAVIGLVNDNILNYMSELIKAVANNVEFTTKYGGLLVYKIEIDKIKDYTYLRFRYVPDTLSSYTKNMLYDTSCESYNRMFENLTLYMDELIKNYCCAIIIQVLKQWGIDKVSNALVSVTYTALCKEFGQLNLVHTCIYLRYKYFNPVVITDIEDENKSDKRIWRANHIIRKYQPYFYYMDMKSNNVCEHRENHKDGLIYYRSKVCSNQGYSNKFAFETKLKGNYSERECNVLNKFIEVVKIS